MTDRWGRGEQPETKEILVILISSWNSEFLNICLKQTINNTQSLIPLSPRSDVQGERPGKLFDELIIIVLFIQQHQLLLLSIVYSMELKCDDTTTAADTETRNSNYSGQMLFYKIHTLISTCLQRRRRRRLKRMCLGCQIKQAKPGLTGSL